MKKFVILNIIILVNLLLIIMVTRCIGGGIMVEERDKWEERKFEVLGRMYEKAEKEGRSYLTQKEEEILEKELAKIEKQEIAEKEKEFQKFYKMMTQQRREPPPPIKKIIRQEAPMSKSLQKPQQVLLPLPHKEKEVKPKPKEKIEIKITQEKQQEKTKKQKSNIMPFVLISLMLCVGIGMYLSLKKIK